MHRMTGMSSSSQSSKGKEPEFLYTPSSPNAPQWASPSSSPEAKRRRLEPAHEVGEPSARSCAWYPGMIRGWIREERVPSFEFLPRLFYPLEQAFAAVVSKMTRELQGANRAIVGLSQRDDAIECGLERLRGDLTETDQLHSRLVAEVRALRDRLESVEHRHVQAQARVATVEHGLALAQARVAELEARVAEQEEDPEEDPEDAAEAEDGDGEIDD